MKNVISAIMICAIFTTVAFSQSNTETVPTSDQSEKQIVQNRHSVGASVFMLSNFFPDPADYYLLNYGYRLTQKDRIFIEFNTWKYAEPIGTYGNSDEPYPGFIRAFGIGAGYQRFHWKGMFTTIEATAFTKHYFDKDDDLIQKGLQVYMQFVAGYRFEFFEKRYFVEPALALKYWPVDTNFPADFAEIEKGAPIHIFEPSLNCGFRF